jgi:hypothetical protein
MGRFVTGRRVGAVLATMALSTSTLAVVVADGAGATAHHTKAKHSFSAPTTSSSTTSSTSTTTLSHDVLTVGTYANKAGQYQTIQAAVDAAKPGDTILVAPGDYKETADLTNWNDTTAAHGGFGGVLVTTPNLTIRGLNRNTTIIDGTKGAGTCSSAPGDQQFGYVQNNKAAGRNGIVIYEANNVSIDNLTTCNFLTGNDGGGNGVWWNGGADTATINLHGYEGSYLSATSTYFAGESAAASYGIFSSDAAGPATWSHIYANNMNDSGMYVGACKQLCGITITDAWMENSALGYSGTNSGGAIVITNSRFDHNKDGFDTNTQIAGDPPAPQNGACPNNGISPITHTHSCWVLENSVFNANNNPNVPEAGTAAGGPTGTGMTLSGGRNDTVMNNTFSNNNAWGLLLVPYPDSSTPEYGQSCTKTGGIESALFGCVYDPMNDAVLNNTFTSNGSFGNPSNGDLGQLDLNGNQPSNCFVGNKDAGAKGLTQAGQQLQSTFKTCGVNRSAPSAPLSLLGQVLCDTGFGGCSKTSNYPKPTGVKLTTLPGNTLGSTTSSTLLANTSTTALPTMPNPCQGVPDSLWCSGGQLIPSN